MKISVRSAYPDRQGTSSIFPQRARKNLHSFHLDSLDFCRGHYADVNGEQDKKQSCPRLRPLHYAAKPSPLLRRLSLAYAGLCPAPRPRPKNKIGRFYALSYFFAFFSLRPLTYQSRDSLYKRKRRLRRRRHTGDTWLYRRQGQPAFQVARQTGFFIFQ